MSEFAELLSKISELIADLKSEGCDIPFFRGHGDATWQLKPSLARTRAGSAKDNTLERTLYYDVLTRAGALIPANCTSWDTLFIMQHHRIPTRLLDWTETFSVALYFAVKDFQRRAAIWVLNPFELNLQQSKEEAVLHPQSDIIGEYFNYFIMEDMKYEPRQPYVLAVLPNKSNERVLAQKAVFTLHWNLSNRLEALCPKHVYKFEFSANALDEASEFLELAGTNEYSLFPDLDGLARWMKMMHRL